MFPHGRWVKINEQNPDAVARCDRSGQLCNYNDLVKQMDYRGLGLVWTGLYVNKYFLDEPNPQSLNPVIRPDPPPLEHPRPWQTTQAVWPTQSLPWNTQTTDCMNSSTTCQTPSYPVWASWGDWGGQVGQVGQPTPETGDN